MPIRGDSTLTWRSVVEKVAFFPLVVGIVFSVAQRSVVDVLP